MKIVSIHKMRWRMFCDTFILYYKGWEVRVFGLPVLRYRKPERNRHAEQ